MRRSRARQDRLEGRQWYNEGVKDRTASESGGTGPATGVALASQGLGIAKSLQAYARPESNVVRDLDVIARFFGIKKTGNVMAALTGATSSSLWRAGQDSQASGRVAGRIAILAALALEMQKYLVEMSMASKAEPPQGADMYRWLMSGRMETPAGPRRPLEVLSDPEGVALALAEIRAARTQLKHTKKPGAAAPADVDPSDPEPRHASKALPAKERGAEA